MTKYACRCCGYLTLDEVPGGSYEICPVCFWEDDYVQSDYEGGANRVSLNQAQDNFQLFGACDEGSKVFVRLPLPEEIP